MTESHRNNISRSMTLLESFDFRRFNGGREWSSVSRLGTNQLLRSSHLKSLRKGPRSQQIYYAYSGSYIRVEVSAVSFARSLRGLHYDGIFYWCLQCCCLSLAPNVEAIKSAKTSSLQMPWLGTRYRFLYFQSQNNSPVDTFPKTLPSEVIQSELPPWQSYFTLDLSSHSRMPP